MIHDIYITTDKHMLSLFDEFEDIFVQIGWIIEHIISRQCSLLIMFEYLQFQLILQRIYWSIPWESNQVRITKHLMFILLQPLFCLRISRISTSQLSIKHYITLQIPIPSLNTQLFIILSLVTFAQILDALTTLWSLSALGCTVILLTISAYSFNPFLSNCAYLPGSPTVSA